MILSIDPSILSMGWCVFDTKPIAWGTIKSEPREEVLPLAMRIHKQVRRLREALHNALSQDVFNSPVQEVVIERPQQWGAYQSVASVHSDSLPMLYMLVGALIEFFRGIPVDLVTPAQHKGQLPKEVTTKRMQEKYSIRFETSDEADAVWIADWFYQQKQRGV